MLKARGLGFKVGNLDLTACLQTALLTECVTAVPPNLRSSSGVTWFVALCSVFFFGGGSGGLIIYVTPPLCDFVFLGGCNYLVVSQN